MDKELKNQFQNRRNDSLSHADFGFETPGTMSFPEVTLNASANSVQRKKKEAIDEQSQVSFLQAPDYQLAQPSPVQLKKSSNDEKSENIQSSVSNRISGGLPENLRTGIESLSGIGMDDVKVHYNSSQPAQLQAHAFAQGTDIHLGSGQERHLPHEAWHVVQQKQGRVQPTTQMKGTSTSSHDQVNVNDNAGLEREADVMGDRAIQLQSSAENQVHSVGSVASVAPIQMKRHKNIFKRMAHASRRKKDKKLNGALEEMDTGTASDVYKAKTQGSIGKEGSNVGFAKKAIRKGEVGNDTTTNLGFSDGKGEEITADPNLIARQVISSRLDKKLGLNVLSDEIFSKDQDGSTIGISGRVSGKENVSNIRDDQGKLKAQKYNYFDYSNPLTQKGLSDLQIEDAITNQLDRHGGNIFIDPETGQVKGIDNDMAFHSSRTQTGRLANGFKENEDGSMSYNQEQMDADSAEKVLALSDSDIKKVLKGRMGDGEKLDKGAIEMALKRFRAVKAQAQKLKDEGSLITDWNQSTYDQAIDRDKDSRYKNSYASYLQGNYEWAQGQQAEADKKGEERWAIAEPAPGRPLPRVPGAAPNKPLPALPDAVKTDSESGGKKKSRNPFKKKKSSADKKSKKRGPLKPDEIYDMFNM